eukprot:m.291110 g.291110  ORF g.291110 m.291110 type:complete len:1327 (+) comp17812_c0_seq4:4937-8917(+)
MAWLDCLGVILVIAASSAAPATQRPRWHFSQDVHLQGLFPDAEASQAFLTSTFQKTWQHYTANPAQASLTAISVDQTLNDYGYDKMLEGDVIDIRDGNGDILKTKPSSWESFLADSAYTGQSLVTKPELLDKEDQQALKQVASTAIQLSLQQVFETTVTQHLYASREGAMALQPHTDGGDVFVHQLRGEKHWTVCVPQPKGCEECNDADKALLQEVLKHQLQGCTRYDNTTLKSMACSHFTMVAGDVLYLPRGTVHVATTSNTTSIHMTYQLQSKGHTWAELSGLDVESVDAETYWLLHLGQTSTATSLANPMYRVRQRRSSWNSKGSVGGCNGCEEECDESCDSSCDPCPFCNSCDSGCDGSCDTFRCASSCCPTGQACPGCRNGGCYNCQAGKYAVPSTGCRTCPTGKYQPSANQAACITKTKTCPASQYVSNDGGATADRSCTDCFTNQYQPVANQNSCITKTRRCSAGQYVSNPNSLTSDRICVDCIAGKYQPNDNSLATSCLAKTTTCPSGHYLTNFDSLVTDSVCTLCPTGTAQPTEGTHRSCQDCQPGHYTDQAGQTACKPCPQHTFTSARKQASCQVCDVRQGLFQPQTGQAECIGCGRGQRLIALTYTCTLCPSGTFQNQDAATTCKNCQAGTYSIASRTSCASCAAGKYSSARASRCQDCAAGKVQPQTGQGSCVTCAEGKYQSQSGKTICVTCVDGLTSTRNRTMCTDVTPPVISGPSSAITVEQRDSTFTYPEVTATDSYDGVVSVTRTGSVDINTIGEYTLTYTAVDSALNQAQLVVKVEVVDPTEPVIKLNGLTDMVTEAGQPFKDPFGTITDPIEGDLTADLASDANTAVNTNALGQYTVTYYMTKSDKQGLAAFNVTRTVRVEDTIKPIITLTPPLRQVVEAATTYTEPGYSAIDSFEGDLTANVSISQVIDTTIVGVVNVVYSVSDTSGNAADSRTRVVEVKDTLAPVIALVDPTLVRVPFATRYDEPGFTAVDANEGDLTSNILVQGTDIVDASLDVVGTYNITYTSVDGFDNTATAVRAVQVEPFSIPVDDSYIFRLEYSQPLSLSPSASDFETTLRDNVKQPFLFILSRYDAAAPNRFNALPNTRAATAPNRRRLLSADSTVYEFAVRDTESLQWLTTAELPALPDQVTSTVPDVASVKPATAESTADIDDGERTSSQDGSSSPNMALVGGLIGTVVLITTVLLLICLIRRNKARHKVLAALEARDPGVIPPSFHVSNPTAAVTPPEPDGSNPTALYDVPELAASVRRPTVWRDLRTRPQPGADLTGKRRGSTSRRTRTVSDQNQLDEMQYRVATLREDRIEQSII